MGITQRKPKTLFFEARIDIKGKSRPSSPLLPFPPPPQALSPQLKTLNPLPQCWLVLLRGITVSISLIPGVHDAVPTLPLLRVLLKDGL